MKRTAVILVVLLHAAGAARGAGANAGTAGASFTRLAVAPEVVSLGGAYAALSGVNAVLVNPAGIAAHGHREVSLAWQRWVADITLGYAAAAVPVTGIGAFGLGMQYYTSGAMDRYDAAGTPLGDSFSANGLLLSVVYARPITDQLALGAGVKYVWEAIDDDGAVTFSLDLGGSYAVTDRLTLGLSLQNLLGEMRFIEQADPMPLLIRIGASYRLLPRLLAVVEFGVPGDADLTVGLGVQYTLEAGPVSVPLRLGYTTMTDIEGFAGLSVGAGCAWNGVLFDIAWLPAGELGSSFNVSLGYRF